MKDPLRYYISEGFMSVFWFNENSIDEKLRGTYYLSNQVVDRMKIIEAPSGRWLLVDDITYLINNEFFKHYGIQCESEEDAVARCNANMAEIERAFVSFKSICHQLAIS